jgi:hypothetical protein
MLREKRVGRGSGIVGRVDPNEVEREAVRRICSGKGSVETAQSLTAYSFLAWRGHRRTRFPDHHSRDYILVIYA